MLWRIGFLLSLWLCLCCNIQASNLDQSLNLDQLSSINLLTNSQMQLADQDTEQPPRAVANHVASAWQPLGRDQLRLGLTAQTVWLATTIQTQGMAAKDTLLVFHRLIDDIDVWLYEDDQLIKQQHIGAYLHYPADFLSTNKNLVALTLQPKHDYRLLIKLRGHNAITGTVTLWDAKLFKQYDQTTLYFFIAYAVAVFAIALHNVNGFLSTQNKVFLIHVMYAIALLVFQAGQYGYMDYLFQNSAIVDKELLLMCAICIAYSAVLWFIISVIDHSKEKFYLKATHFLMAFNVVLMLVAPFMNFHVALSLFALSVLAGILLGVSHVFLLFLHNDKRGKYLLLMMLLFAPSSSVLLLSRFGLIDDSLLSEHLILLVIVGEMLFMSFLMFSQIRQMRQLFWQAQFLDPSNKLYNIVALRHQLKKMANPPKPYALSYCWIAGLERMEIAKGSAFRDTFLQHLAKFLEAELQLQGFVLQRVELGQLFSNVFYCEKNTLGFVSLALNDIEHRHLYRLMRQSVDLACLECNYTLSITPMLASANAKSAQWDGEQLIQNTSVALAQCLQSQYSLLLYNDEVGYLERRKITLLHDFEQALQTNQFYLEWQPQLDSHNQSLSGLEALVRWRHPVYGDLAPGQFIPLLEQSSVITGLSIWVVNQVFANAPSFLHHYPDLDISINLSVYDLMHSKLLTAVDHLLASAPSYITHHIIMEVTESVLMEDNERVLNSVKALQSRGFRISIDDFGAGYASFGYLQTLPANELKIDKRYTDTCHEPNSQAIIRSIIDLALRLNMTIVVEGIENRGQQQLFTDWGAHRLQGWMLGKPATQNEILTLYHA